MALPSGCTIDFMDISFDAFAVHVGLAHTPEMDRFVVPSAGRPNADIRVYADMYYAGSISYEILSRFMNACLDVNAENVSDTKLYLWADESHQDALITFSFKAWVAEVTIGSIVPEDAMRLTTTREPMLNYVMGIRFEPIIDEQHGINIVTGN